jgi:hypothetical protein
VKFNNKKNKSKQHISKHKSISHKKKLQNLNKTWLENFMRQAINVVEKCWVYRFEFYEILKTNIIINFKIYKLMIYT